MLQIHSLGIIVVKKFVIVGLLVVFAVVFAILSRQHVNASKDSNFRHRIIGAWSSDSGGVYSVKDFADDGTFRIHEEISGSQKPETNRVAGTWRIKDGRFILIITKDSCKGRPVPRTNNILNVLKIDASECIVTLRTNRFITNTNRFVWKKGSP